MELKQLVAITFLISVGSMQGLSDKEVFVSNVYTHISILEDHLKKMEQLYQDVEQSNQEHADAIIQQMTSERTSFNKRICSHHETPKKRIIGFYVYHWYERNEAVQKLKEHIDDVKKHKDQVSQLIASVKHIDPHWAVNPQTTKELMASVDQTMKDDIMKIIFDFKLDHCNAVGFGYIAKKHGEIFESVQPPCDSSI